MQVDLDPPFVLIKPGVSEEEFYRLEGEDSPWELLDGRLVMTAPSRRHEELFGFLLTLFRLYIDERGGGVVLGSRCAMRLDERWSPEPDLLFVRDERRHLLTSRRLEGPADLVVEIVSEGDPSFERREKLPRYREAKIPEIWLVDPLEKAVTVETAGPDGYRSAIISSGPFTAAVLPDFWLEASWLWQDPLPPALACLRQILCARSLRPPAQ